MQVQAHVSMFTVAAVNGLNVSAVFFAAAAYLIVLAFWAGLT